MAADGASHWVALRDHAIAASARYIAASGEAVAIRSRCEAVYSERLAAIRDGKRRKASVLSDVYSAFVGALFHAERVEEHLLNTFYLAREAVIDAAPFNIKCQIFKTMLELYRKHGLTPGDDQSEGNVH